MGSTRSIAKRPSSVDTKRRKRGGGGVIRVREGVEAEIALARLKIADHEKRLPTGGTSARSVSAAFRLYLQAVDAGFVELAPRTRVTVRSAAKTMATIELPDGRVFGDIRLSRLTWSDIEQMYAQMRATGRGVDWIRRCVTVLTRTLDLTRKRGFLDSNPAKDAARPRSSRTKPFSPSADEVRKALATATERDPEVADAVSILVSTGARRGEVVGAQVD